MKKIDQLLPVYIAPYWTPATRQALRFVIVGVLNTAFGYAAFLLLHANGIAATWALLLSTIAGVLFNFMTTGRLVFDNSNLWLIGRFVAVYSVVFAINALLLAVAQSAGLDARIAQAGFVLPMALLSFLLMRTFVFRAAP